jgi:hypothetical protein
VCINGAQSGCSRKDRKNRHPEMAKLMIIMTYLKSTTEIFNNFNKHVSELNVV